MNMKSWHRKVTAIVPHKDTVEVLAPCLAGLEAQSERPHIVVVDCSTTDPAKVVELCGQRDGVSLHHLDVRQARCTQESMAWCWDAGFATVQTEFTFCCHADVLFTNKGLLTWLIRICSRRRPVVGYETFDRREVTQDWRGMVGNLCSLWHMPTYHTLGLHWNYGHCLSSMGVSWNNLVGWPDVETGINRQLRGAAIGPYLVGQETDAAIQETEDYIHIRSYLHRKNRPSDAQYRALVTEHLRAYTENHLAHTKNHASHIQCQSSHP